MCTREAERVRIHSHLGIPHLRPPHVHPHPRLVRRRNLRCRLRADPATQRIARPWIEVNFDIPRRDTVINRDVIKLERQTGQAITERESVTIADLSLVYTEDNPDSSPNVGPASISYKARKAPRRIM